MSNVIRWRCASRDAGTSQRVLAGITLRSYNSGMETAVRQRLLALNRQFYQDCAATFAQSRGPAQGGLRPVLPWLPPAPRILDVGCGNGRLGLFLAEHRTTVTYVGLDGSSSLLAAAHRALAAAPGLTVTLFEADLDQPNWPALLEERSFDAVFVLGVVHHLPGFAQRAHLLEIARGYLAAEAVLVVSYWQFLDDPAQRAKVVPWDAVGIDAGQVDPGDALLSWRRGTAGLRYCHHVDAVEAAQLAAAAGLAVVESYYADGRSRRLNLFQVCRLAPGGSTV